MSSPAPVGGGSWPGLVLASVHLLLGLLLFDPTLFTGGDNAGYMILGEALISGTGYRDIYLPAAPLHTKYPPLYPLLLAALTPLGGLQLFKLASLGLTTSTVWMTYRLGTRLVGRLPAILATTLLALSPVLLEYSHWVLSEALFVLLVATALLWLQHDGTTLPLALGLAAAGGAFLTRTAGLPLLAAVVLFLALERKPWRLAAAIGTAAVTAGGWWTYQRLVLSASGRAGSQPTYLQEMLLRNPYDPAAGTAAPADLVVRATDNAWRYASEILPRAVAGSPAEGTALSAALMPLGLLLAGLAFAGWARRSGRRVGPAELFALLYGLMLLLWPTVWTDQRFLLPLLPLILLYASAGALGAGRWLRRRSEPGWAGSLPALALTAVLGIGAAVSSITRMPDRIHCLAAYRAGSACDPPAFASFYEAAEWTARSTAPESIVVSRKPRIFYWISGRRGDIYPYSSDTDRVLAGMERIGADYVVVDAISGTTDRYLVPALRAHLARFQTVYEGGDPPTFVLRFDPQPVAAD